MDNAFERARAAYGTGAYDDATLEFLFPQLKESEDERIRKAMLQHFKNKTKEKWCNIPVKDIISWLEKQKEHQNNSDAPNESSWAGMISSSDKDKNLDEIAQDYVNGVKEYNPEPTWDLIQTAVCYGYHLGANHQVLDNEHLLSAIQVQFASHAKVENGKRYAKLTWDEFKKIIFELFESIRPQSKIHYWTEEEIEPIISDYLTGKEHYGGMIARLRCLKPKSSWKPSEEQMKALNALNLYGNLSYVGQQNQLISLYQDLKKLM